MKLNEELAMGCIAEKSQFREKIIILSCDSRLLWSGLALSEVQTDRLPGWACRVTSGAQQNDEVMSLPVVGSACISTGQLGCVVLACFKPELVLGIS